MILSTWFGREGKDCGMCCWTADLTHSGRSSPSVQHRSREHLEGISLVSRTFIRHAAHFQHVGAGQEEDERRATWTGGMGIGEMEGKDFSKKEDNSTKLQTRIKKRINK